MVVIFDLDGTLYRTHETSLPVFRELCGRYGIALDTENERFVMYTTTETFLRKYAPAMPAEQRAAFRSELERGELAAVQASGRLFDGVPEMLASLSREGIGLAICGMARQEYIEAVLNRCGVGQYFTAVRHGVDGVAKTHILKSLLSDLGLDADQCLMVGDSVTDLVAARDNGVPFLGVGYGYGASGLSEAGELARDVTELVARIHQAIDNNDDGTLSIVDDHRPAGVARHSGPR